jgi:hypothetical protein
VTSRVKNIQAYGGRYGPGKVHLPALGTRASDCIALCTGSAVLGVDVGARENPVTCKKCLKQAVRAKNPRLVKPRPGFYDHTAPWSCSLEGCGLCARKPSYEEYMGAKFSTRKESAS